MSTHRDQDRPLAGLRVVECATFVAGPSGGMALAQLGADVIRVDPIGGGPDHRRWPVAPAGGSLYWNGLNKGKRSVTVDLSAPEGRELVTALITAPGPQAGILLENTGRAWLSHETLAKRRPDLIHLRVQGHADGRPHGRLHGQRRDRGSRRDRSGDDRGTGQPRPRRPGTC